MSLLSELLVEAKKTTWDKLNAKAEAQFGKADFTVLSQKEMGELVMISGFKVKARALFGVEFHKLDEKEMEQLFNKYPHLLKFK